MPNIQKRDIVASVQNSIKNDANFALVEFDKINHQEFEEMRRELKKIGAKLKVVKNTLFEKAVNQLSQTNALYKKMRDEHFPLQNKSALLTFSEDWADGLKKYHEFSKKNEYLLFKLGLIEKIPYGKEGLTKLAQLPSKQELLAKLIGAMKNPMARTTRSLKSPMQKLVFVLNQKGREQAN